MSIENNISMNRNFRKIILFLLLLVIVIPMKVFSDTIYHKEAFVTNELGEMNDSLRQEVSIVVSDYFKTNGFKAFDLAELYYAIADYMFDENQLDWAEMFYIKALEIFQNRKFFRKTADCQINLGILKEISGNTHTAISYYQDAMENYQLINFQEGIAYAANNMGLVYAFQGNFEDALRYLLISLEIEEKLDNQQGIAYSLNNLGLLCRKMGRINEALDYYHRSLKIKQNLNDMKGVALTLGNIGSLYENIDSLDKAIIYFNNAADVFKTLNNTEGLATNLHNMGVVFQKQNKYTQALDFYFQSLELREQINHIQGMASSHLGIAQCYIQLKQASLVSEHLEKALKFAQQMALQDIIVQVYLAFSDYYQLTGNYQKAIEFFKLYSNEKDKQTELNNYNTVVELQTRFETTEKEQKLKEQQLQIDNLNKDRKIQNLQIQRNKFVGVFLFIILALMIVLVYSYYKRLKFKNEINQTLELKNIQLEDLNNTKNKLFSIISHDMKNLAGVTESVSGMLHRKYDKMDDDLRKKNIQTTYEAARQNKNLIEELLQWALTQSNRIKILYEEIDAEQITGYVYEQLFEVALSKNIEIKIENTLQIPVYGDRSMLTTILRNLCSNAIKFSETGSIVSISVFQKNKEAHFSVTDSGIGLSEEDVKKLFRSDVNPKEIGNHSEKGTGFGLIICKEFAEINKGRIFAQSVQGKGSTFTFTVPLTENHELIDNHKL